MAENARPIEEGDLRNRFEFHPATAETGPLHDQVRASCLDLALALNQYVPDGREKATAISRLEEVMMWANAAIARH